MKRQEQSHSVWIDAEQHQVEDRRGRFEIEGQGGRPMEGTGCAWKRRVGDLEGRSRSLTGERLEKQAGGPWTCRAKTAKQVRFLGLETGEVTEEL